MACIQLWLDVYGIDTRIDTPMLKKSHNIIVHLAALDNGIKPDIYTLKKCRGDIFLECCAESFKAKIPRYVNEVLFKMVKKSLKDTYLGVTTPTALKNKVSTCRHMYYDRDPNKRIMVNNHIFRVTENG